MTGLASWLADSDVRVLGLAGILQGDYGLTAEETDDHLAGLEHVVRCFSGPWATPDDSIPPADERVAFSGVELEGRRGFKQALAEVIDRWSRLGPRARLAMGSAANDLCWAHREQTSNGDDLERRVSQLFGGGRETAADAVEAVLYVLDDLVTEAGPGVSSLVKKGAARNRLKVEFLAAVLRLPALQSAGKPRRNIDQPAALFCCVAMRALYAARGWQTRPDGNPHNFRKNFFDACDAAFPAQPEI